MRIDKLVVERGVAPSREKAQRLILAGEVLVDDRPVDKPGTLVPDDSALRLRHPVRTFVSRGGEKLAGALDAFGVDVSELDVLDVGASTGGFTDCLLKRGARSVTALDVGRAQLDLELTRDPAVTVVDRVNARHLRREDFPAGFDLITADLAFISLTKVLPALATLLRPNARLLLLVKPQFELSAAEVGRGGIVREKEKHERAVEAVAEAIRAQGLSVGAVSPSVIKGAKGNQEFFLLAGSDEEQGP